MMLGLCENVCRPSTGRSVPQILTFCVLIDPFKRKIHSSEKTIFDKVLRHTLLLVLEMTDKDDFSSCLCW